jgi:septum formation protein
MALILASASPRRQELLRNAGISFTVRAANIPEIPLAGESPQAYATRLAREKVRAVSQQPSNEFVLGADTIVVVDGEILGKPRDETDAARMLRLLSDRTHEVITGVCLLGGFEDSRYERTLVSVSALSEEDIRQYVATREPMDKAGAYAIQGVASRWIHKIEGDYFNVVGLPVALVYQMLREHHVI